MRAYHNSISLLINLESPQAVLKVTNRFSTNRFQVYVEGCGIGIQRKGRGKRIEEGGNVDVEDKMRDLQDTDIVSREDWHAFI